MKQKGSQTLQKGETGTSMQQPMHSPPLTIFCVAAPNDSALLSQWEKHLQPLQHAGLVSFWSEQHLFAGASREYEREHQINQANLIFLLLSADFFSSPDCLAVMEQALQRSRAGTTRVIPLLLRPVAWEESSLNGLSFWPSNGMPITQWSHQDEAWHACIQNLRRMLGRHVPLPLQLEPADNRIDAGWKQVQQDNPQIKQKLINRRTIINYSIAILVLISIFFLYLRTQQFTNVSPAEHAWQDYVHATQGTPDISDPLKDNNLGNGWFEGTDDSSGQVSFSGNAYHILAYQQNSFTYGYESLQMFSDVAFQVSVTILSENSGVAGVVLGYNSNPTYVITIGPDQHYEVDQIGQSSTRFAGGTTSFISAGFDHSNTIEVLTREGEMELYINNKYIKTVPIAKTSGYIGFVAEDNNGPCEATFQNFKLWT